MIECITPYGLKQSSNRRRGLLPKSFFYHSWERGNKITVEYYPATSLARFFSDEGVGSAVDCAPQRKKVSIRSGVRIPVEQWSSPTD